MYTMQCLLQYCCWPVQQFHLHSTLHLPHLNILIRCLSISSLVFYSRRCTEWGRTPLWYTPGPTHSTITKHEMHNWFILPTKNADVPLFLFLSSTAEPCIHAKIVTWPTSRKADGSVWVLLLEICDHRTRVTNAQPVPEGADDFPVSVSLSLSLSLCLSLLRSLSHSS